MIFRTVQQRRKSCQSLRSMKDVSISINNVSCTAGKAKHDSGLTSSSSNTPQLATCGKLHTPVGVCTNPVVVRYLRWHARELTHVGTLLYTVELMTLVRFYEEHDCTVYCSHCVSHCLTSSYLLYKHIIIHS